MSIWTTPKDVDRENALVEFPNITAAATRVSLSGTSAESSQLSIGRFEMWCDVDCHWRQGATGGTAVTTDKMLFAGEVRRFRVENATTLGYVQAITGGASGNLWIQLLS